VLITPINILALVFAYLIGSIPTSVWLGKFYHGIDIREHGSGNAGATNTFRIFGKKLGIIVLIVDILKGWIAVKLFYVLYESGQSVDELFNLKIRLGICALLGHVFPIYVGFKGGKGVATALGVCLTLVPWTTLGASIVFISVYKISKFVSLGSISASISMPIIYFTLGHIFHYEHFSFSIFIILVCISVLILILHLENIKRLLKGEELKATNRGN